MRIALACHNFPPEFQGGTERVVCALACELRAAGADLVIITGSDLPHQGADLDTEDYLGLPVRRIRRLDTEGYGLELGRPRVLALVERILREHHSQVLHVHHWATLSTGLLRLARQLGLGTVATLHDMWTTCGRFFRQPPPGIVCPTGDGREACGPCAKLDLAPVPLWGLRVGIANRDRELQHELRAAHYLTAPSQAAAARVKAHTPWPGPIEVVPHGLLEPARQRRRTGDPAHRPFRVGTFGNLVADKGVAVLVEAMAGIPGAELHLWGPFLRPEFHRQVLTMAQEHRVTLHCHGSYDPSTAHPALEMDLAVFPSLCEETYGLVVEEALARGVPVLVSDRGALAERIGGGGLVSPAGDVLRLRQALRSLVQDPQRYAAVQAAIPTRFPTIRDAAERYRALYAAAQRGPTPQPGSGVDAALLGAPQASPLSAREPLS